MIELLPSELKVLHLLSEGLPNYEIAQRLQISQNTVCARMVSIKDKLNASSRRELVAIARHRLRDEQGREGNTMKIAIAELEEEQEGERNE